MLYADKRALETNLQVSLLKIREKELQFYTQNCIAIGTQARGPRRGSGEEERAAGADGDGAIPARLPLQPHSSGRGGRDSVCCRAAARR